MLKENGISKLNKIFIGFCTMLVIFTLYGGEVYAGTEGSLYERTMRYKPLPMYFDRESLLVSDYTAPADFNEAERVYQNAKKSYSIFMKSGNDIAMSYVKIIFDSMSEEDKGIYLIQKKLDISESKKAMQNIRVLSNAVQRVRASVHEYTRLDKLRKKTIEKGNYPIAPLWRITLDQIVQELQWQKRR